MHGCVRHSLARIRQHTDIPYILRSQQRVLRLSKNLLDLLGEWAGREGAAPEERTLAKQLHEDFSRCVFPPQASPLKHMHASALMGTVVLWMLQHPENRHLKNLHSPLGMRAVTRFSPASAPNAPPLGTETEPRAKTRM